MENTNSKNLTAGDCVITGRFNIYGCINYCSRAGYITFLPFIASFSAPSITRSA